jgi:hypothetical protein
MIKNGTMKKSEKGKMQMKMSKSEIKNIEDQCEKGYCNPDCKGTIFEKGKGDKLPRGMKIPKTKVVTRKVMKKLLEKMRKDIFKGKNNILKNSFYNKLSATEVKKAKKEGALSGCTLVVR